MADDLALLGLEDEIPPAPPEEDEQELFGIWADNLRSASLFLALSTQWDVVAAPDGEMIWTGLRYDRVEIVMRNTTGLPKREWPETWSDLRAMERAALIVMNRARHARREERRLQLEASRQK